jgi:hypothetical protein
VLIAVRFWGKVTLKINCFCRVIAVRFLGKVTNQQYKHHLFESFNHFHTKNIQLPPPEFSIDEMKYWFVYTHHSEEAKRIFFNEHDRPYNDGINKVKKKLKELPQGQELYKKVQEELSRKIDFLLNN